MKFDAELFRTILMEIAKRPAEASPLTIPGRSRDEITYHLELMRDGGLIKAMEAGDADGAEWWPERLTSKGREYLEAVRSDTAWNKVKAYAIRTGKALTFEVLKAAVVHYWPKG